MSHKPSRNYRRSIRIGIGLGSLIFVIGVLGQVFAPRVQGTLPDWELSMFVWFSIVGIVVAVLSVFVFGVALPLTE